MAASMLQQKLASQVLVKLCACQNVQAHAEQHEGQLTLRDLMGGYSSSLKRSSTRIFLLPVVMGTTRPVTPANRPSC